MAPHLLCIIMAQDQCDVSCWVLPPSQYRETAVIPFVLACLSPFRASLTLSRLSHPFAPFLNTQARCSAESGGEDVSLHKAVIKELEGRITATEAAAEKFELKCQEAQKIMVRGTR